VMVVKPSPRISAPAAINTSSVAPAMKVTPYTTKVTQNAAGTKTISNISTAPSKPAVSDATQSHYDDMAKTFAAQATGNYTVQFELVCEAGSLTKAIKDGGSSVWFVPISYRNRSCYRVFWGHFTTHDEATRATQEIPMSLRSGAAAVVVKVPKP